MIKTISISTLVLPLAFCFMSCGNQTSTTNEQKTDSSSLHAGITQKEWGETDGKKVFLYTLTNKQGDQVTISNYGGTITSWTVPDKNGNKSSIIIGYDKLEDYLKKPPYFGATIGRYGNRIGKAQFQLDGKTYKLAANNGPNSLHGGLKGFDKVVWDAVQTDKDQPTLTLKYLSKDGEEGYPGNLSVTVKFTLTDSNALNIDYTATTDKNTPVNLTNHSYFNLSGDVDHLITDESLWIDADHYTPVDTTLIPTGEIKSVKGTPFDFTQPHKIGERIDSVPGGYDHNFVLNKKGTGLQLAATVTDDLSGRKMDVYTDQPGLQFYSGNFLDGTLVNRTGKKINQHSALCLETQHFPDSPNKPNFPSTILKPGQEYHTVTEYRVSVSK